MIASLTAPRLVGAPHCVSGIVSETPGHLVVRSIPVVAFVVQPTERGDHAESLDVLVAVDSPSYADACAVTAGDHVVLRGHFRVPTARYTDEAAVILEAHYILNKGKHPGDIA